MGLSKRVNTTALLESLNIPRPGSIVHRNTASLYNRICHVKTPLLDLTSHFLSEYLVHNTIIPGTIVSDILCMGISPVSCAFNKHQSISSHVSNGHIDTIRALIYNENVIKPYSDEHFLLLSTFINKILLISGINILMSCILSCTILYICVSMYIFFTLVEVEIK